MDTKTNLQYGLDLDTKKGFETSVGTITVNPSVRYSPVNKLTDKGEYWNGSEKKNTVENNELRAGVKVSLDVK